MCRLLILLFLWVSPSTSERCYDVEKLSSWSKGYKGLLTIQAEEITRAWSVGICFTDGIENLQTWKGIVVRDPNDPNCFNITNKRFNGILYSCQCLAIEYIARFANQGSLNVTEVTEVSFNGLSLPNCSDPLDCEIASTNSTVDDAGAELICTPNPLCAITGCLGGCCIDGMCCNSCPKIINSTKEEVCGFCSSTFECPQSCPYCLPNIINDSYQCVGDSGLKEHIQLDLDNEIANLTSSNLVAFQSANSNCSWFKCAYSVLKALHYCYKECAGQQDCIVPCAKKVLLAIQDKYCWPCIQRGCCKLNLTCCYYEKENFTSTPEYRKGSGFNMYATCDDTMQIFADSFLLATSPNWRDASTVFIPAVTNTIQINCVDTGGIGGILASSTTTVMTDNTWTCSWDFGITWNTAFQIQSNAVKWGGEQVVAGISPNAFWIWTGPKDWHGRKKLVACKINLPA